MKYLCKITPKSTEEISVEKNFATTEEVIAESIDYLREHEPPEGYYVGFSGGKDSICTLELCRMAGVKHEAFYSCTRIDPPEVVRFIKEHYPDVQFLFPKETFWAAIKHKAPPLRMQRWCCDVLKKDPGKDHPLKSRAMGIRAEESNRRAARPRTDLFKKYKLTLYKPIFFWTEYHVWDFIERNNLPYPSMYDEGFGRIGCVVCPFMMGRSRGKRERRAESMRRWPGMWKAFENSCRSWFAALRDEESRPGKKHKTFDEYYAAYLNGFEPEPGPPEFSPWVSMLITTIREEGYETMRNIPFKVDLDQRLFIFPAGAGLQSLGFDVCYQKASALADEMGSPVPNYNPAATPDGLSELEIEAELLGLYQAYVGLVCVAFDRFQEFGTRSEADLTPQLLGLEGQRVEVEDSSGEVRRFIVGRSSGFLPCHLELKTKRSQSGAPAYGAPYKRVTVVKSRAKRV